MKTFQEIYEDMVEKAQEVFLADGYHTPIVLVCVEGKTEIVGCSFKDNEEKQAFYQALSQRYQGRTDWYIFITEGWFTSMDKEESWDGTPPSEDPNRRECLLVIGGEEGEKEKSTQWEIFRDPIRLEGRETLDNSYSAIGEALFGTKAGGGCVCVGKAARRGGH